ncbi:MAG: transglutaminase-like domain-containing protein [Draconibacterium sp.]|nr:transglutaminase-like domain-containing protein [Draconibacterium sp.]
MRRFITLLIVASVLVVGCQSKYHGVPNEYRSLLDTAYLNAGDNAEQIFAALENSPKEQKEAAAFLIAFMPESDLKTLSTAFISDQIKGAFRVCDEFGWCKNLPDSIFLNEVLPYFSLDENRDNWREDYYNRFSKYVQNCKTIYEAIDSVNLNIRDELNVDYNTKRSIVNISPFQAEKENMATCTGLSFLLVDAFRSVGIPARLAGTPLWTNMRGNHSWVEVWIDGEWFFTEYYPDALNKSWFLADAGKADPEKPVHWIYATSYKTTGMYFPRVWKKDAKDINGVNVTERYIRLYQEQLLGQKLNEDELLVDVVLYKNPGSESAVNRVSEEITVWNVDKKVVFGFTPMPTDDLNKFLIFKLKKNVSYRFEFPDAEGNKKSETIEFGNDPDKIVKLIQQD